MDPLNGLLAFVRTAELGSFVAAGRALQRTPSAIGKAVARLEQDVGVRLIQRSTRRMQLTAEGKLFHERCRRALDELADARALLVQAQAQPRGLLRVSAPVVGHHFLLPLLPDFLVRYPDVEVDLHFTDRPVDLIDDGVDIAIRSGDLADSGLISRPLQAFRLGLWASPDYLRRRGAPQRLVQLGQHDAVKFRHPHTNKLLDWPLPDDAEPAAAAIRTVLACNHIEAVLTAALKGIGIVCLPDFLVREMVADGRLRAVLPDAVASTGRFKALWQGQRHLSPKVRAFVDHLTVHLTVHLPGSTG
ncbi:LysR family transcriptional regulator [Ideonella sp. DXS29W]|uniref:LysR family transcriptional regulator n=1 Tax=Ideonella lacteola TaxID=2984193 RepID=A0ABU9BVK8_9BURK